MCLYAFCCSRKIKGYGLKKMGCVFFINCLVGRWTRTKFVSLPLHISSLLHYNPSCELWEISPFPAGAAWTTFRTLQCAPLALCFFSLPKCGKVGLKGGADTEAGLRRVHLLAWQVPVSPSLPLTAHVPLSSYAGFVLVFSSPFLTPVLTQCLLIGAMCERSPIREEVRAVGWVVGWECVPRDQEQQMWHICEPW